jgi:hypothetical protein
MVGKLKRNQRRPDGENRGAIFHGRRASSLRARQLPGRGAATRDRSSARARDCSEGPAPSVACSVRPTVVGGWGAWCGLGFDRGGLHRLSKRHTVAWILFAHSCRFDARATRLFLAILRIRVGLMAQATNPVTYPEPAQRGFPSPLWDDFKKALAKLWGGFEHPAIHHSSWSRLPPSTFNSQPSTTSFCSLRIA